MSQQVKNRRSRTDWAHEGAVPVVPPHERRSASAQADRELRASALAAHSGRIMESLQEERSHTSGYTPASGPTGEKPTFSAPIPATPTETGDPVEAEAEAATPKDAPTAPPGGAEVRHLFEQSAPAPDPVAVDAHPAHDTPEALPATSIPQLIRELAGLRDDGILTEEEFAAKKAELLARL